MQGRGGPPLKSLDSDENFKLEHMLFCRELGFVAIYALFGDLWAKKVPFWVKNSALQVKHWKLRRKKCLKINIHFGLSFIQKQVASF